MSDSGRPSEGFEHLLQANALKRQQVRYDEAAELGSMHLIAKVFSAGLIASLGSLEPVDFVPIFIVGMPRSGSPLIEQILGCHPDVSPGGELWALDQAVMRASKPGKPAAFPRAAVDWTRADLADMRQGYIQELIRLNVARGESNGTYAVTDKRLDNFRYLGLIKALFPNAILIHARRNPVDTCLSCFSLLFGRTDFSYDLSELGRRYHAYRDLMAHWHTVLPENSIYEVRYERIVSSTEVEIRQLLAIAA